MTTEPTTPEAGMRLETDHEHMVRDMKEGTFPRQSPRQNVPLHTPKQQIERARSEPDCIISAGLAA